MTKVGTKKPRGKPFVKGEDPRRVHGKSGAQVNEFTREMKRCLLDAAEQSGNRMVAISNERLPKRPNQHFSKELLALLRQDPQGMTSYFMWLAEHHPAIFVSLLGRALPQIMQHEQGADPIEAMISHRRGHRGGVQGAAHPAAADRGRVQIAQAHRPAQPAGH